MLCLREYHIVVWNLHFLLELRHLKNDIFLLSALLAVNVKYYRSVTPVTSVHLLGNSKYQTARWR